MLVKVPLFFSCCANASLGSINRVCTMREEPREQDECGCCFYSTYLLNGKFFVSQKNANFAIVEPDGRKQTIRPSENVIRTILNNFLLMENYGYSRMNGKNGRFENRFAPRSSGGSQWPLWHFQRFGTIPDGRRA